MRKIICLAVYLLLILMLIPAYSFAAINLNISNSTTTIIDSSTFKMNNITADIDGVSVPGQYWIDFKWDSVNLVFVPINVGAELNYKTSEYLPLGQGDTWTVLHDGVEYDTVTVSGTEEIDSVIASKMMTADGSYQLLTSDNNGIRIYKQYEVKDSGWSQMIFSPPGSYVPGEVSIGKTYTGTSTLYYTNSEGGSITGPASVEVTVKGTENVTVPAGTFKDCLKLGIKRNLSSSDGKDASLYDGTLWLAKGVGKVKETATTIEKENGVVVKVNPDTDELVSANVGGVGYPK